MKQIFILISLTYILSAQYINAIDLSNYSDSLYNQFILENDSPGAVLTIVSSKSILLNKGYGLISLKSKQPVDATNSVFQLGSVGKIFTAIAVLQEVDANRLNLTDNIQTDLTQFEFKYPFTLENLLSHTAGFDERVIGYMARTESDVERLGIHLEKRMPSQFTQAGKTISYSNYSYALAGYKLEQSSGIEFSKYIKKQILQPLDMNMTGYHSLYNSFASKDKLVTGYSYREDQYTEIIQPFRSALPAGSIASTGTNMALFLQAILRKDSLLSIESWSKLYNEFYSSSTEIGGYSLGFEIQKLNDRIILAKGGAVPGFMSVIVIYPFADLAIFSSINTTRDRLLAGYFEKIHKKFVYSKTYTKPIRAYNVNLDEYVGSYRSNRYNHSTIEDMLMMFRSTFNIWLSKDGNSLTCYHDNDYQNYTPISSTVFINVNIPDQKLIFTKDSSGKITGMIRNDNIAGIYIQIAHDKVPFLASNEFINEYFAFIPIIIIFYLLSGFFRLAVTVIRKYKQSDFLADRLIPIQAHILGLILSILTILWVFMFFMPEYIKNAEQLLYGLDSSLYKYFIIPPIQILISLAMIYYTYQIWFKYKLKWFSKSLYSIVTVCSILWLIFLYQWHFIGINV